MIIDTGITENWLPIYGYEGLYELSDHGRIRNVQRVYRIVGSWYQCTLTNMLGEQTVYAISGLLQSHFGTKKRKVYQPIKYRRKSIKNLPDSKFKSYSELSNYLNELLVGCSGNTPAYKNYLLPFNITVDQIIYRINDQLGCHGCSKVIDQNNLTIEWNNGEIEETTSGFLSIFCLRYWLMKNGFIDVGHNKYTGLYPDEQIKWKRIVYDIMRYRPQYDFDENELDEAGVKFYFKKGKNKIAPHKVKNNIYSRNRDDVEIDDDLTITKKLNYSNFTTFPDERNVELSKKIYELLPKSWLLEYRECTSKSEFNRIIELVFENLYPEYSMCEISCELYMYQGPELWIFFKKLNPFYQKIILKEIGK